MHAYDLILTLTGGLSADLILGFTTQRLGLSPIVSVSRTDLDRLGATPEQIDRARARALGELFGTV